MAVQTNQLDLRRVCTRLNPFKSSTHIVSSSNDLGQSAPDMPIPRALDAPASRTKRGSRRLASPLQTDDAQRDPPSRLVVGKSGANFAAWPMIGRPAAAAEPTFSTRTRPIYQITEMSYIQFNYEAALVFFITPEANFSRSKTEISSRIKSI